MQIYGKTFASRLLLGTSKYPSPAILKESLLNSHAAMATVSIRRENNTNKAGAKFWEIIRSTNIHLLPNTAGCRTAKQAITTALMAQELFETNWIKLEVVGEDYLLYPDSREILIATQELIKRGFFVLPYMTDDLVLASRLLDVGCQVLMPWAAPIGSGAGICNKTGLRAMREKFPKTTLIVDAGIGVPSDACKIMEMGFDGILLNTAVARAQDPVKMAKAFALAIDAGYKGASAGPPGKRNLATPSTPIFGVPLN